MKITCINHCIYKLQQILEYKKLQVSPGGTLGSCMLSQYPFYNTNTEFVSHISFYSSLTASPSLKEKGATDIREPYLKVTGKYEKF